MKAIISFNRSIETPIFDPKSQPFPREGRPDREHSPYFCQWHCFFALACALVPHSGLCRSPLERALDLLSQKKNKRLLSKNREALSLLEVGLGIKGGGRLHSACCNTARGGTS